MSKKARQMALIGGLLGGLKGAQEFAGRKALEEAELRKEQRLAAIRAQERSEDKSFQREQTDRTITAQAERDKAQETALIGRDERQNAALIERDKANAAQRMREIGASTAAANAPRDEYIELTDGANIVTVRASELAANPELGKGRRKVQYEQNYSGPSASVDDGGSEDVGGTSRVRPAPDLEEASGKPREGQRSPDGKLEYRGDKWVPVTDFRGTLSGQDAVLDGY